ncbi:MAG: hypothetical protein ABI609_12265 [Acidobacteriota bacterium]
MFLALRDSWVNEILDSAADQPETGTNGGPWSDAVDYDAGMQMTGATRIVAAVLVGLSSIAATPSFAASLDCSPGSRPAIEALAFFSANLSPEPGVLPEWREAIRVCQDHRLLGAILQSAHESVQPGAGLISRGRITAQSWTEVATASRAAQIGFLHSCRVGVAVELLRVEIDITWHGAGTRINKFHLSSSDQALPPCPPAANDLWQALFGVELEPGAEVVEIL